LISDVVANQVVRLRKRAGMNREQLAQRCADLGWPSLTYGVIGSIETGRPREKGGPRTREVSVDELVGLGTALDIPPVLLVTPPGVEQVELGPGRSVRPWTAFLWLIGRVDDPALPSGERWKSTAEQVRAAMQIVDVAETIEASRRIVYLDSLSSDPVRRERSREEADAADRDRVALLAYLLAQFRKWEVPAPPVPAHVVERATELGVDLPTREGAAP
jgi:transcriptional regulator with XRE-family HTH domain